MSAQTALPARPSPPRRAMAEEMRQVDAVIQRRLASKVALIDQIANYIISAGGKRIRPMLVLLFSGALGFTGESASSSPRPSSSSTPRRCCTTTSSTNPAAPRPQHGERDVRQRGQRAGRRLRLFPRLPDDGGGRSDARPGGPRRRHQRDRRRRSAAAHEHARPEHDGARLPASHPLQDGQAVRGQRSPGCGARRGHPKPRKPAPPTAARSERPSSSSTTCSTTRARPSSSARTWATTCAKASRPCRCSSPWSAARRTSAPSFGSDRARRSGSPPEIVEIVRPTGALGATREAARAEAERPARSLDCLPDIALSRRSARLVGSFGGAFFLTSCSCARRRRPKRAAARSRNRGVA